MDALAQKNTKYALLHVDIAKWGSPVAQQFRINSIPYLQVYDANGRMLADGKEAYKYLK